MRLAPFVHGSWIADLRRACGARARGPRSLRAAALVPRRSLAGDRRARRPLYPHVPRRGLDGPDRLDGRHGPHRRPHLPEQGALRAGAAAGGLAVAAAEDAAPGRHHRVQVPAQPADHVPEARGGCRRRHGRDPSRRALRERRRGGRALRRAPGPRADAPDGVDATAARARGRAVRPGRQPRRLRRQPLLGDGPAQRRGGRAAGGLLVLRRAVVRLAAGERRGQAALLRLHPRAPDQPARWSRIGTLL